jgi:hypothetical protein
MKVYYKYKNNNHEDLTKENEKITNLSTEDEKSINEFLDERLKWIDNFEKVKKVLKILIMIIIIFFI